MIVRVVSWIEGEILYLELSDQGKFYTNELSDLHNFSDSAYYTI